MDFTASLRNPDYLSGFYFNTILFLISIINISLHLLTRQLVMVGLVIHLRPKIRRPEFSIASFKLMVLSYVTFSPLR